MTRSHTAENKHTNIDGFTIEKQTQQLAHAEEALEQLAAELNTAKGAIFASTFEYTGRYSRWEIGFVHPPLELHLQKRSLTLKALNSRGEVILHYLNDQLPHRLRGMNSERLTARKTVIHLPENGPVTDESERTRQPSVFTVLRMIKGLIQLPGDHFLGLYGAFGYDLIFQFESIEQTFERPENQKDLILYLPDELIVSDRKRGESAKYQYHFSYKGCNTREFTKNTHRVGAQQSQSRQKASYEKGRYAGLVRKTMTSFKEGRLYEVVPSQLLQQRTALIPSEIFSRLKETNPSPYGFLISLGDSGHLIGASPEMFVRVEDGRVETCPISGTIKRGADALDDAEQIKALLNSYKDEIELTMCTDVDRNDKARICEPGSVKVLGRRQVETYSRLFHTVDHIEGKLQSGYDALDAFMTHMWAVTVTGSPKPAAVQWIENNEQEPREWYGGAVGFYTFDGSLNTGLTLRTIHLKQGVANIRAGATVLHASDPEAEEEETLVKASALLGVLDARQQVSIVEEKSQNFGQVKILLVDHEDSFVHTLADYFRQTGASVSVCRTEEARRRLSTDERIDLTVLSPGPGAPAGFRMGETIERCLARELPIFGVCLGFQGLAEFFGGGLAQLSVPCHGEKTPLRILKNDALFEGIAGNPVVGRYHSLFVEQKPELFAAIAESEDGVLMAARHVRLPIAGVQFHPESILSAADKTGLRLIENVLADLLKAKAATN